MLSQALAMRKKLLGEEHWEVSWSLTYLAWVLRDQGKLAEAETVSRQALAMKRKLLGDEHQFVVWSLADLARVLVDEGRLAEAAALFREAAGGGNPEAMNTFAWFLATCEDPNIRDGSNAVRIGEKAVAATESRNPQYLDTLAAAYAEAGRFADAVSAQQEAIDLMQDESWKKVFASRLRLYESGSPYRDDNGLARRTQALLEAGKFAEAEPLARECLALREKIVPDDWRRFNAKSMLGGALLGQKKYTDAGPLLLSGYEGMKNREAQIPAAGKVRVKETLQRLVQLCEETSRPDKAAEWRQELAEFEKAQSEPSR
jgi:tetratricopeptide (TPR) repeat protein